jgi:hypothetical protein
VIHLLFRDVDCEGSDVIAIFEDKKEAEYWRDWCIEHRHDLRYCYKDEEPRLTWERMKFKSFPGDDYHVESWDVRQRTYGNLAAVSKVRIEE